MVEKTRLKQYKGKWIPANQTQNLPRVHPQYTQKIPSIKYRDIYVGFTALTFCKWERTPTKSQDETPYTEAGRQINFERTKKKRIQARFDELYSEKSARAISYGKWGKLNNFEFIMNRAWLPMVPTKLYCNRSDEAMAVFRVECNKGYTVMSNHYLRNKELTLRHRAERIETGGRRAEREHHRPGRRLF